jgi:hypothetical protein
VEESLKYPLGFLITKLDFINKYDWQEYKLRDGWYLYYSSRNEFIQADSGQDEIIVLGYFFDIRDGNLGEKHIVNKLFRSLQVSYDLFLDELAYLSGRFLVILSHEGETKLFHDVAGLKNVCFHKDKDIVASHDSLINEVTGNQFKQLFFSPSEISFSYHTRYEFVEKLIPNMSLEISSKKLERYYPTKSFPLRTRDEIKTELKSYLYETVKWLDQSNYKPLLSLTGGGDSRTSLAILKPIIKKVQLFTYLKDTANASEYVKKTYANDEKIVRSIVENLNLNHMFFNISKTNQVDASVIETIKHNVMSEHGLNLSYDYYKMFSQENYMHLRSTGLFNVGKYIFPYVSLKVKEWDIEHIAKYVQKWTKIDDKQKNIEHLEHLLIHAQLQDFYNYNPLEILFISYRLIQWHSGVVSESDIAFNTMLLLNSRKIVDLLLSYPIEDRIENKLFLELTEDLWPILNFWDINSTETLSHKYRRTSSKIKVLESISEKLFLNLISTSTTQENDLIRTNDKNGLLYKFSNTQIKENDYYEVRIDLSDINENVKLRFKIEFFYNNAKGRDRIIVSSNFFEKEMDILDLYGQNEVNINVNDFGDQKVLTIKVVHINSTTNKSWVEASRLWIGGFEVSN